ncbi:von Willebrand factor type A domain protein, partial [Teladorsagia circumcincta]
MDIRKGEIKTNIINVLEDVDIGPGRSRIAVVQYALQPSVVFGFDKYYSLKSVQRGVERMSYTGGATMLAKALSFAAGLLYREQNMRDVKKRKHKLMPTPRHDRLQVLCLVSDGASDDNIDKSTAYLHEKLNIK